MDVSKYRIVLPGTITGVSILAGLFAIFFVIIGRDNNGYYTLSCWLIIFAGIFDGLDGKVARLTRSSSEFGIQFDSIADVITFGTAASVVLFKQAFAERVADSPAYYLVPIIFLLCGAIRLARFNTTATTGAKKCFYGLPIPAAASAIMGLFLFFYALENIYGLSLSDEFKTRVTVFYTLLVSCLMVSLVEYSVTKNFFFNDILKHWFRSIIHLFIVLYLIIGYLWKDDAGTAFFFISVFYILYHLGRALIAFLKTKGKTAPEVRLEQE